MLNKQQGPAVLRIALGLLFLVAGINKFRDPTMFTGMLEGLGFPAVTIFVWLVIIIEIGGGAGLILGKKFQTVIWPIFSVLLVALILVHLKNLDFEVGATVMNFLWHVVGLGALLSLHSTGPGKLFGN